MEAFTGFDLEGECIAQVAVKYADAKNKHCLLLKSVMNLYFAPLLEFTDMEKSKNKTMPITATIGTIPSGFRPLLFQKDSSYIHKTG